MVWRKYFWDFLKNFLGILKLSVLCEIILKIHDFDSEMHLVDSYSKKHILPKKICEVCNKAKRGEMAKLKFKAKRWGEMTFHTF